MAGTFKFWYDEKWYSVQGAETMISSGTRSDLATMRAEYTRMRDVAQKRLQRLSEQFPESKALQAHQGGFAKLKEIAPADFAKAFSELAKFVRAKGSTVSGQKEIKRKTIKTWQEQGLNVNEENYDRVIKVMEKMRTQKVIYGSDKAVDLVENTMELSDGQFNDILDKHLAKSLEHSDEIGQELQDVKDSRSGLSRVNMDDFIDELGW